MNIKEHISLKNYNTFKVDVTAKYFSIIKSTSDLHLLLNNPILSHEKRYFLGMGANTLFTKNFNGIIIKSGINHIKKVSEDKDYVYYNVGSGVVWNEFVNLVINENLSGIENLIDIPGLCGSATVQNIGAYGMEIKDSIVYIKAVNADTPHQTKTFKPEHCKFGYRDSIFRHDESNYFITDITFRLNKNFTPVIKYKDLIEKYKGKDINTITLQQISQDISDIRARKLPDYTEIYNAGSFFKNPVVPKKNFDALISKHNLTTYPVDDINHIKLSAAQLIELSGLKGLRIGDAGVSDKHSLIICNYGNAEGQKIYELVLKVISKVYEKFGLILQPEVKIL